MKFCIIVLFWINLLNVPYNLYQAFHFHTFIFVFGAALSTAFCLWANPYAKKNQEVLSDDEVSDRT